VRIERIELRLLSIPLIRPFETSFGREDRENHIIIKLFTDGIAGYGETPVMINPGYSYETVETAWHVQKDFLIPLFLSNEFHSIEDFNRAIQPIRGHNCAKHGFEGAVWHLLALKDNKPLYRLLGGTQKTIKSGVSCGIEPTIDMLLEQIRKFLKEGYKRVKIKIKPGWEIEPIRAIRDEFGDIPLMVDANSAFSLDDLKIFRQIDEHNLMMIEQPLHHEDLTAHAELQRMIRTPVCLDESIKNISMAEAAIALGSCKIINIKPARVGGLYQAKRIHDLCQKENIPVWCGGMLEMGIGRAQNIALSTLPNFTLPGDVSSSTKYFNRDIIKPTIVFNNGELPVPETPGLGFVPDDDAIDDFTIREHTAVL